VIFESALKFTKFGVSGVSQVCGVTATGDAYCAGNGSGLGNKFAVFDTPQPVVNGTNVADINSNTSGACMLKTDGRVYCWGGGASGQLGGGPGAVLSSYGDTSSGTILVDDLGGTLVFTKLGLGTWGDYPGAGHSCALVAP
jgi:hypothetical protein